MRLFVFLLLAALPAAAQPADTVYTIVDQPPVLLPTPEEAQIHIAQAFVYPPEAARAGVSGTVFLRLVVDPTGRIRTTTVLRGVGKGCDAAAVEAVRQVQFAPGRLDGLPVSTYVMLPVACRPSPPSAPDVTRFVPAATCPDGTLHPPTLRPNDSTGLLDLQRRLRYPAEAQRARIEGREVVQFVVKRDGTTSHFSVVESPSPLLNESAIDAIRPATFKPALCDDTPVPILMTMPLTFLLR